MTPQFKREYNMKKFLIKIDEFLGKIFGDWGIIDNIRYSFEARELFQRQVEEAVNTLINKNNTESDKAFSWFMN